MLPRWPLLEPIALGFCVLCASACRDVADKDASKPALAPECASYIEQAKACHEKAESKAKHALDSVYMANQAVIDKADTKEKMGLVAKQCIKWTELLGKNPQCK